MRNLSFFLVSVFFIQTAKAQHDKYDLINRTPEILLEFGPSEMLKYVREKALKKTDLVPLREEILAKNNGNPKQVPVLVHPDNAAMIVYANKQLKHSGIDFLELIPEFDTNLPEPSKPFREDKNTYQNWVKTRAFWGPLVGLGTTLVASTGILSGGFENVGIPDKAALIPAVAQGLVVLGLELQFAVFSNIWSKHVWSKDRLPVKSVKVSPTEAHRLKKSLNDLAGLVLNLVPNTLNKGLEKTNLKASYFYNYFVNYLYASVVYAAGYTSAAISGVPWEAKGFGQMLLDNAAITTAFWFAFGLNQVLSSELAKRGEISELRRFQIESMSFYLAAPSRVLSLIPNYMSLGVNMQLLVGAMMTVPNIFKLTLGQFYSKRTAQIFEQNRREPIDLQNKKPSGGCQGVLAKLYTSFPWVAR